MTKTEMILSPETMIALGDFGCNIEDEDRDYRERVVPQLREVARTGDPSEVDEDVRLFIADVRLANWDWEGSGRKNKPSWGVMVITDSREVANELAVATWRITAEEAARFILEYIIGVSEPVITQLTEPAACTADGIDGPCLYYTRTLVDGEPRCSRHR